MCTVHHPRTIKHTKIYFKYQHRLHVSLIQPLIPRTVKLRLFSSSVLPQTDDELLSPAKDWRLTMRWIARPSLRNLKISPPPIRGKDKLSQSSSQEFRIDSYKSRNRSRRNLKLHCSTDSIRDCKHGIVSRPLNEGL